MTDPRFVVIGDVFNDIVAIPRGSVRADTDTPASIWPRPGGSGANTAAWLGALGRRVDFVGVVGADGREAHAAALRDAGVEPHLAVEPGVPTGTLLTRIDGDTRSMLTDRGANNLLRAEQVTDELLAGAAVLHTTGYGIVGSYGPEAARVLVARANAFGVPVSLNCGSAGFIADFGAERFLDALEGVTVLVANAQEGRLLAGCEQPEEVVAALLNRVPIVALTLSREGSLVAERGRPPIRVPAYRVRLVDPSGAGDAWIAGFLSEWAVSRDIEAAAALGTFTAARAVVVHGGRPPM